MNFKPELDSLAVRVDSYKVSMPKQYPPGTSNIFSYIEPRGGRWGRVLFIGLQAWVKKYLLRKITKEQIDFAEYFWKVHGEPFDRTPWDIVINEHNGYLPITIRAVKEGTVLPVKNILCSVELTKDDERLRGLVTWTETSMLRGVWYPTTVATQSWHIKQMIKAYLEKTGDPAGLPFNLHDLGARGVSSGESCEIGAAAHLVNFMGTDSVEGILHLNTYYNAPLDSVGFSIPAAEHSTITSWTKDREFHAYANMVDLFAKEGSIFAVVSDSYNIYQACMMWVKMKERVLASGATLVVRPDSGDPLQVIPKMLQILEHGFTEKVPTPEGLEVLGPQETKQWSGYPVEKNSKGYKTLKGVRIIWGDGINPLTIESILRTMTGVWDWSADMFAFGMGGALLQGLDRDTQKFAMKCSAAKINGEWVDVFKDPVTDPGKASKAGRLALHRSADGWSTGREDWLPNALELVYRDGVLIRDQSLAELRAISEGRQN